MRGVEAVDEDGVVGGVVLFDRWTGVDKRVRRGSAETHVVIVDPACTIALRRGTFAYVFEEVGVDAAWGAIRSDNERALRFAAALGFKPVFRGRDWHAPGIDAVLVELRRADCRWLRRK
jgi:hypothetical protein